MRACLICSTHYATSTPGCAARCANTIKEGTARRETDEEGMSHFQMPIITYFAQTRQEHQTCFPNFSGQELPKKNWSYSQVCENTYMLQHKKNMFHHFSPILKNMFNWFLARLRHTLYMLHPQIPFIFHFCNFPESRWFSQHTTNHCQGQEGNQNAHCPPRGACID